MVYQTNHQSENNCVPVYFKEIESNSVIFNSICTTLDSVIIENRENVFEDCIIENRENIVDHNPVYFEEIENEILNHSSMICNDEDNKKLRVLQKNYILVSSNY